MRSPIVILADQPKAELDAMAASVRRSTGLDIMTRQGLPYNMSSLKSVSAADAATIIILDPSRGSGDHGERPVVRTHGFCFCPFCVFSSLAAVHHHLGSIPWLRRPRRAACRALFLALEMFCCSGSGDHGERPVVRIHTSFRLPFLCV